MDARKLHALVALAAFWSLGANARTEHFLVSAPTAELAHQVATAAEHYRKDLAIDWLGKPLGPWADICPIQVVLNPLASGETSFVFPAGGGHPRQWRMIVEGPAERILDSVLPHEILHTVFATHFQNPLPRWADEGACTTVEHEVERTKHDHLLLQRLHGQGGIAFNEMFRMKEYPRDILSLYSQGYSVANFLIAQGGRRKFVEYVGEGMRSNNWTATTRQFYAYDSLSDLQTRWVRWVGSGSQPLRAREPESLVATTASPLQPSAAAPPAPLSSGTLAVKSPSDRPVPDRPVPDSPVSAARSGGGIAQLNATAPAMEAKPSVSPAMLNVTDDGWYVRTATAARQSQRRAESEPEPQRTSISRARHFEPAGQTILQWSRDNSAPLRR